MSFEWSGVFRRLAWSLCLCVLSAMLLSLLLLGCGNPALTSAKIYLDQHDSDRAREQLELAAQQIPGNEEVHYLLGKVYAEKRAYKNMRREFAKALAISAVHAEDIEYITRRHWAISFNRGVEAYGQGNFEEALKAFDTALSVDPDNVSGHRNRAICYHRIGEQDSAIVGYRQALALSPTDTVSIVNIGLLYVEAGEHDEAVRYLESAAKIKRDDPETHMWLGFTYMALGDTARAITTYERAGELSPDDGTPYNRIGAVHHLRRDYERAVEYYRKAVEHSPQDADFLSNLTSALVALERLQEAHPYFERLVELEPENGTAWLHLGRIYEEKGMVAESQRAYDRAKRTAQ